MRSFLIEGYFFVIAGLEDKRRSRASPVSSSGGVLGVALGLLSFGGGGEMAFDAGVEAALVELVLEVLSLGFDDVGSGRLFRGHGIGDSRIDRVDREG